MIAEHGTLEYMLSSQTKNEVTGLSNLFQWQQIKGLTRMSVSHSYRRLCIRGLDVRLYDRRTPGSEKSHDPSAVARGLLVAPHASYLRTDRLEREVILSRRMSCGH